MSNQPQRANRTSQDGVAALAVIDYRTDDLPTVLRRVAELAKAAVPGADEVSVSLIPGQGRGTTPAFTGQLAIDSDEAQYDDGGPCVAAALGGDMVMVADMNSEERWPGYVPRAREVGVRSSMSLPLPVQADVTGALNVYATRAGAFDHDAVQVARTFAGYAAVAVANAHSYRAATDLASQMQEAMTTRAAIEQAKGIIMAERRCSPDEAFAVLVDASNRSNRKLRDIAGDVVAEVMTPRTSKARGRPSREGGAAPGS
jgi:GAF domain-containing protein